MVRIIFNKIFCSLFYTIVLIGLCYQVYEVSKGYFTYPVMTSISFNFSPSNQMKAVNIRFLYYEAIDKQWYEIDTVFRFNNDASSMDMYLSARNFTANVTIDDIMQYTPTVDDLIDVCDLRSVIECNPNQHISIEKLVSNYFIVYRFKFHYNQNQIFDESTAFYVLTNYGDLSYAQFKPKYFKNIFAIALFLNSMDKIPFIEISIAPNTDTGYDFKTGIQKILSFGLKPHSILVHKLQSPYETKCWNHYNMYECYSECVNEKTIKFLNRLAPLKFHREGNMKQLTYFDMKNETIYVLYNQFVTECKQRCPDTECVNEVVITKMESSATNPMNFHQALSDSPSSIVRYHTKVNLPDYLTLVMSCFGTWLALSILSLNPFKWNQGSNEKSNGVKLNANEKNEQSNGRGIRDTVIIDRVRYQRIIYRLNLIEQFVFNHSD